MYVTVEEFTQVRDITTLAETAKHHDGTLVVKDPSDPWAHAKADYYVTKTATDAGWHVEFRVDLGGWLIQR